MVVVVMVVVAAVEVVAVVELVIVTMILFQQSRPTVDEVIHIFTYTSLKAGTHPALTRDSARPLPCRRLGKWGW